MTFTIDKIGDNIDDDKFWKESEKKHQNDVKNMRIHKAEKIKRKKDEYEYACGNFTKFDDYKHQRNKETKQQTQDVLFKLYFKLIREIKNGSTYLAAEKTVNDKWKSGQLSSRAYINGLNATRDSKNEIEKILEQITTKHRFTIPNGPTNKQIIDEEDWSKIIDYTYLLFNRMKVAEKTIDLEFIRTDADREATREYCEKTTPKGSCSMPCKKFKKECQLSTWNKLFG